MERTAAETIRREGLLFPGARVAVGVSGGADSVALLHFLAGLPLGLSLLAVHVHHGLREAADGDAAFVEALCRRLEVPCRVVRADVGAEAARRGLGLEETGRLVRYRAFEAAAADFEADRVALAHTRNDQAETVLLWLCRGAGPGGLGGMAPMRGKYIRPLLDCSRAQVEDYCARQGLAFRTDESNESPAFTRNRVRGLLRELEEQVNPQAAAHIAQAAALMREEDAYLEGTALTAYRGLREEMDGPAGLKLTVLDTRKLMALPPTLLRRVLRRAVETKRGTAKDLTAGHLQAALALLEGPAGKRVSLPGGVTAEKAPKALLLYRAVPPPEFAVELPLENPVALPQGHSYVLFTKNSSKIRENRYTLAVDYDTIKNGLVCRTRRPGDRLYQPGAEKKLKDLLQKKGLSRVLRERLVVFACDGGIFWVPGVWAAEAVRPGAHTQNFAWISFEEEKTSDGAGTYILNKGTNP